MISLAAAAALIASACGSDEGGGADGKCSPGATRTCVGPAACQGGQACTADGTWSACDCGGSGGAGGSGGSGGSGTGGAAGGDGSAGTGGSAGDASADGAGGGTQWKDDPCPTKKPIIDCSTGCGGPSASCAQAMCPIISGAGVIMSAGAYPYVLRTPSKPGAYPCDGLCGNASMAFYGMTLSFPNMTLKPMFGLRITVPKPWFAAIPSWAVGDPHCVSVPESQCVVSAVATSGVTILTNDPNAPAVNALVEEVPWPATCP
ncbi:MAG: hypothetical protein L6Q84_21550 [Polyangiaceae bacterium]|nr:hypothetical protein [Polyangiaceae bacterium]